MKKFYLSIVLICLVLIPAALISQQAVWLNSTPINYAFNPEGPQQTSCIGANRVFAGRFISSNLIFGSDIYGLYAIDCRDTSGALFWSFPLGQKVLVERLAADANGNIYVGGRYMETMQLNGVDSLVNTGPGPTAVNLFLFSLDISGNLRWKRNVSLNHATAFDVSALTVDHNGECWYAANDFSFTDLIRVSNTGQDVQTYSLQGTRVVSGLSFDSFNNLFVAGSTQMGTLSVINMTVTVPEGYMLFVARINANGNPSWIRLAHDVTFQNPEVVATTNGEAFVGCNLLDSTTFGAVHLDGPQWVYDIFAVKVDSMGNFHWGVEVPFTPTIQGDFRRGTSRFIDADDSGNLYLIGSIRGTVDWGNGVVSTAGSIPSDGFSIISFNNSGIPRWELSGHSVGFNIPFSVSASAVDECYISCGINDTTTVGSLVTNIGGDFAFMVAKINATTTGIDQLHQTVPVIFPNPSSGVIYFNTTINRQFWVYDSKGSCAGKYVTGNSRSLDLSAYPDGIYLLRILDEKGIEYHKKILIQH